MILKNIEVDGDILQLPSDTFDSENGKGTVIDSGTTLAYLPRIVYDQLMSKVSVSIEIKSINISSLSTYDCSL